MHKIVKKLLNFYQHSKFLKWLRRFVKKITPKPLLKLILKIYHSFNAKIAFVLNKSKLREIKFVGVTGTNGKSTSMAMIAHAFKNLNERYAVTGSIFDEVNGKRQMRNMKSASGSSAQNTPTMYDQLTLINKIVKFRTSNKIDWMGIEFTSQGLYQGRGKGLKLKGAIITNLTQDHLDYHGDMQSYARAKALMLQNNTPDFVILNADDEWFDFFKQEAERREIRVFSIASKNSADLKFSVLNKNSTQQIKFKRDGKSYELTSSLIGKFNAYNLVGVIMLFVEMGFPAQSVVQALGDFKSVPGRMQEIPNTRGLKIVVDYAHTPDAIEQTLEALRGSISPKNKLICVNGAAGERDTSKRPVIGQIMSRTADFNIICDDEPHGDDPKPIRAEIISGFTKLKAKNYLELADRREAISTAVSKAKKGDAIAILGLGSSTERAMNEGLVDWNDAEVVEDVLGF